MSNSFYVIIRQKDSIVWQGQAQSLSSTNEIGPFDILSEHSNFIGLIEQKITVRAPKFEKSWPIDRGIISVKNNQVEVYLGY